MTWFGLIFQRGSKRGSASPFGYVVRIKKVVSDSLQNLLFIDSDDRRQLSLHELQCLQRRLPDGKTISDGISRIGRHRSTSGKRQLIGISVARDDPDNLGRQAKGMLGSDNPADTGAQANRYINAIQLGDAAKKLEGVGRHPGNQASIDGRHEIEATPVCYVLAIFKRCVKVLAINKELRPKRTHCLIFDRTVAFRHHDGRRQAMLSGSECNTLSMITAGSTTNTSTIRKTLSKPFYIDQSAPNLERPGWIMILVLDPEFRTSAFVQYRPADLRTGLH